MKWKVGRSKIHGNGVFANQNIKKGESIGIGIPLLGETPKTITFERNTFGLLINESKTPNAETIKIGKDWHFVAIKDIIVNEEIFVDYSDYEQKIDKVHLITKKAVSVI